ncbi:MAG: dTDP-4-dehydrorhamnose reductase [Planctomycetales bacterium]|nr:dTDP-4-dehydrorhamnose reductase [Planctomycetales bacterium]
MAVVRVAILGGKGMLGSDVVKIAPQRGYAVQVCDLPEFDMTQQQQVKEIAGNCDVIVNCAAYTNVEKAESQPELADEINAYAVGRLGQIARAAGIAVLHIGTDFVFDGKKQGPYVETDAASPLGVYGRSKLLGERLLFESGCTCCIIRVQWTYGRNGVNFITKILDAAKTRDCVQVVDDQVGSPTHTAEAAKAICDCLGKAVFPMGLFHFAASGYVSRYEMTRFLFERMGIKVPVKACKTSEFKTAAQRPLNSRFCCHKIENLLGRKIPGWQNMLENYLEML